MQNSQESGDFQVSAQLTDLEGSTFEDLRYQINDPTDQGGEAEYIRSFLLNGFHRISQITSGISHHELPDVDETSIAPHEGDMTGGKIWTTYNTGNPYIKPR